MAKYLVIDENRKVELSLISAVSEILNIQQNHTRMYCFTINLKDKEIINVLHEYSEHNQKKVQRDMEQLHFKITQHLCEQEDLPETNP